MNTIESKDHNEIQEWRRSHPNGFLCNKLHPIIHKSTCIHHLGDPNVMADDSYDLGNKTKVLSISYDQLIQYLIDSGLDIKKCSHCIKKDNENLGFTLLSPKQKDVLHYFIQKQSKSATATEIAQNLSFKSVGAVNFEIWRIAEKFSLLEQIPPEIRDDGSNRWWSILFSGEKQSDGMFLWTLKKSIENVIIKNDLICSSPTSSFNTESHNLNVDVVVQNADIPPRGIEHPKSVFQSTRVYERDRQNKVYLISQNGCVCELCGWVSDITDKQGDTYIEMHHLRPLSENGSDRIANCVLLCPNCHRRLHYSSDAQLVKSELYKKIERLIEE